MAAFAVIDVLGSRKMAMVSDNVVSIDDFGIVGPFSATPPFRGLLLLLLLLSLYSVKCSIITRLTITGDDDDDDDESCVLIVCPAVGSIIFLIGLTFGPTPPPPRCSRFTATVPCADVASVSTTLSLIELAAAA